MEAEKPLLGKTVLNMRGKRQAADFSHKIIETGGIPIEIPLLAFQKPTNTEFIFQTIKELHTFDWLIFTSKNGIDFFFDFYAQVTEESGVSPPFPKIAVVGSKTEKALLEKGHRPDLVPDEYIAEGLFESLKPFVKPGSRFLLARGNLSRSYLVDELTVKGAEAVDLIVYDTIGDNGDKATLCKQLKKGIDFIVFTSPSTVNQFYKMVKDTDWLKWTSNSVFACIGPETQKAALQVHIPVHIVPENYTIDDLLAEMIDFIHMQGGER
ncbi:uroporphyrinogen-III synthase [Ferdinandcohnia sp. Marseille-Q9671]